jgi:hypothetical protein
LILAQNLFHLFRGKSYTLFLLECKRQVSNA